MGKPEILRERQVKSNLSGFVPNWTDDRPIIDSSDVEVWW